MIKKVLMVIVLLLIVLLVFQLVTNKTVVDIETYELPKVNDRDSIALSMVIDDGELDFNDFIVGDGDTITFDVEGYSNVVVLLNENSTIAYRWSTDADSRSEHFDKESDTDKVGDNNDTVAFYIDDVMAGEVYTFTYEHMSDTKKPTVSFKIKFE